MVTSGNANSANTGLAFVWGCACLPGFSYKKADLRALFRHIDPATRKPEPNAFLQYMRRAVGVSVLNRPTAYLMSSLWALKQKFRWVIGRVWLRPTALRRQILLVSPPISSIIMPLWWVAACSASLSAVGETFQGFISASLVSQVAAGDVNSGRHAYPGLGDCLSTCSGRVTPIC